jgi:hypothetical protein
MTLSQDEIDRGEECERCQKMMDDEITDLKAKILTDKERQLLLEIVKSLNPREDVMGALLSKSRAFELLGDSGVIQLTKKLENR